MHFQLLSPKYAAFSIHNLVILQLTHLVTHMQKKSNIFLKHNRFHMFTKHEFILPSFYFPASGTYLNTSRFAMKFSSRNNGKEQLSQKGESHQKNTSSSFRKNSKKISKQASKAIKKAIKNSQSSKRLAEFVPLRSTKSFTSFVHVPETLTKVPEHKTYDGYVSVAEGLVKFFTEIPDRFLKGPRSAVRT